MLAIFARFPRLGKVKTRLAASLGAEAALQLHQAFLLDTIDRFASVTPELALYLADSTEEENLQFAARHALPPGLLIRCQNGSNLGQRLWDAYRELSRTSGRVVFVGTDSPTLPLSFFREARERLRRYPVVLGPATDGGYCLLGLSQPVPEIFTDISWGTSRVLAQTRARLGDRDCYELSHWYDVDEIEDLKTLRNDLSACDPLPLRTAGLLASSRFQ